MKKILVGLILGFLTLFPVTKSEARTIVRVGNNVVVVNRGFHNFGFNSFGFHNFGFFGYNTVGFVPFVPVVVGVPVGVPVATPTFAQPLAFVPPVAVATPVFATPVVPVFATPVFVTPVFASTFVTRFDFGFRVRGGEQVVVRNAPQRIVVRNGLFGNRVVVRNGLFGNRVIIRR